MEENQEIVLGNPIRGKRVALDNKSLVILEKMMIQYKDTIEGATKDHKLSECVEMALIHFFKTKYREDEEKMLDGV